MLKHGIDTLKIEIDTPFINGFNSDNSSWSDIKFSEKTGNTFYSRFPKDKGLPCGIGYIGVEVDRKGKPKKAVVDLSAKILKSDYFRGITGNTVLRVLDIINSAGLVNIVTDPDKLNVCYCDVTRNLEVNEVGNLSEYFSSLMLGQLNPRWRCEHYPVRGAIKTGVVFNKRVSPGSRYNDRLIIYDKQKDMSLAKNKEIMKYLKLSDIEGIVRIEKNCKNFMQIKKAFGLPDNIRPVLGQVLSSDSNCLLEYFNDIYSGYSENVAVCGFTGDDKFKPDNQKIIAKVEIIKSYSGDMDLLLNDLRSSYTREGKSYQAFDKMRKQYYQARQVYLSDNAGQVNRHIQEIKSLLAVA